MFNLDTRTESDEGCVSENGQERYAVHESQRCDEVYECYNGAEVNITGEFKILDSSLPEDGVLLVVTQHCLRHCAGFAGMDSHYRPNSTACTSAGAFRAYYDTDGEAALL